MITENEDMSRESVAEAMGIAPALTPFFSELLSDIWILGSWPDTILEITRSIDLSPQRANVLELGCGKGAILLPLALRLGLRVRGVDLYEPFIQEARARAENLGVAGRCVFELADMRNVLREGPNYDMAILAAVGDILGDFAQTVGEMRKTVRKGGFMIIDDGFLATATHLDRKGYEYYRPHDVTRRQLKAHGDVILKEVIIPLERLKTINRSNTERIRHRAAVLSRKYPRMRDLFREYVRLEENECRTLEKAVVPAVWLLWRA